jgi:hypothetical protein
MIIDILQFTSTILSYELIIFILHPFESSLFSFVFNFSVLITNLTFITSVVHAGSRTTRAGVKAQADFSRILNRKPTSNDEKLELVHVLMQMKLRNLNFENNLFKINWNVLIAVRWSFIVNELSSL